VLRRILLLVGSATFLALIWHIGPVRIWDVLSSLSPLAILLILIPSIVMYVVEAYGWRLTLGPHVKPVPFWRLFLIRTAGELVNMTTPTAYVGGEPLKAYLLKRYGVALLDGLASVVIAKTTMTIAQIAFILLGIAVTFWYAGVTSGSWPLSLAAGLVSGALLVFGTVVFIAVQRKGLFMLVLGLIRTLHIRIRFLENREAKLRELDQTIVRFYTVDRPGFVLSTLLFLLGWFTEAIEVFVMLLCLGVPADLLISVAIAALSVLIKGSTFVIPGSMGAQDAGNLMLLTAFGYSELTGITFALLRRFRELFWIAIGLAVLFIEGRSEPQVLQAP
jgi:uncharacterized protein (TIRG00374 family)